MGIFNAANAVSGRTHSGAEEVTLPPDFLDKGAVIAALIARNTALVAQVAAIAVRTKAITTHIMGIPPGIKNVRRDPRV